MATIILGAGATRGASFVDPTVNPCLPPLNNDFFTQLQKIQNPKHKHLIAHVIRDCTDLFGFNFQTDLETLFSTLEHSERMILATKENRSFSQQEIKLKRGRLLQAIAAVLEESLTWADGKSHHKSNSCDYHTELVKKLRISDTVISFNYDCLIDQALTDFGNGKWNSRYGYSVVLGKGSKKLQGEELWQPQKPSTNSLSIRLLKLHGSLNFSTKNNKQILKARPYTNQGSNMKFDIIPPESGKRYDIEPFQKIWRTASALLQKEKVLVFIGYSFPASDLHASSLFRIHVVKNLKSLVVVNPDKQSRLRTRDILARKIDSKTRILSFNTLNEFVQAPRSLWDASL